MLGDPLPVGSSVPAFYAEDHLGRKLSNESLRGQWVVFVFYVRDDTPG